MAGFLNNQQRITLASFLAYFVMSGMLAPIGIISGPMAEVFDRSVTEVTAQFSWLTMGNLSGAIAALFVLNVFRLRVLLIGIYAAILVSLLSLNLAPDLTAIGIALGVVGFCCGLGLAAAALIISKTYDADKRASMLVVTDASFSAAGFGLAALATALTAASLPWSSTYQCVAVAAAIIIVLSALSRFPQTRGNDPGRGDEGSAWPVGVWLCLAALFLYTLGQYSMLWWLPNYVQTALGATVDEGGRLVTLFWVGLFVAQLVVAWGVVIVGVRKLVLIAAVATCLFSVPLWLTREVSVLPILAFLWGFANLSLLKVVLSFATELVPTPTPRLVSTLLLGATLGTAVSPWVTSRIVEATSNLAILKFSSTCYAVLAVLLLSALVSHRPAAASGEFHGSRQNRENA